MNFGYLYIIKEGNRDRFKIGLSHHPELRLKTLQTGNSDLLKLIWKKKCHMVSNFENWAHVKFSKYNLIGEWFEFTEDRLDFVIEILELKSKEFILDENILEDELQNEFQNEFQNKFQNDKSNGEIKDYITQKNVYHCFKCGKNFTTKQNLNYHLEKMKTKCNEYKSEIIDDKIKFMCLFCDKGFTRKYNLGKHMKKYHPIKFKIYKKYYQ